MTDHRGVIQTDTTTGRTHRQRKELYIKAVEDEILRMKEVCSNMSRDKARLAEENRRFKSENRQLRVLLSHNGIDAGEIVVGGGGGGDSSLEDDLMNPIFGYAASSSADVTGSPAAVASVSDVTGGGPSPNYDGLGFGHGHSQTTGHHHSNQGGQQLRVGGGGSTGIPPGSTGLDYDQAGIEFVLVYVQAL